MNEKLLHFIWKFRLFQQTKLQTTTGEILEIIQQGIHNQDAGADFQYARIKVGNTFWVGNIEIHTKSSDWYLHQHHEDAAYNNVILHVVYEKGNKEVLRQNGEAIATLELKGLINENTLARYEEISKGKTWIPCEAFFKSVDSFTVKNFLERLLIERLESKVEQINLMLQESDNDWENVMFQMIARYLGASINKEPFLLLAKSLPVKVWAKHQNDYLQIEALVFGQAGLLDEKHDDEYPNQLRKEYVYLKRLHNLQSLPSHVWKFLRLRPSNFPTIRMAQLAALMFKEVKRFSLILETEDVKEIAKLFDVEVSAYWQTHYLFDKPSNRVNTHLGDSMKNVLLINAIAPVLFAYGKYKDNDVYCERALRLLENCEAESNSIITGWKKFEMIPSNAYETQALLQLKNEYCANFRCLDCAVGNKILQ
jgi:hypothetical protein